MSKKKVQHKGKPKSVSEESEDCIYRKSSKENVEEEYITVVDLETNKKYSKRPIQSNWSKYESNLESLEKADEMVEVTQTNDLSSLLEVASSDCSHFQFSSEKLWKNENYSVPSSSIFNLDLNILSSGLACVPFYERMGLKEDELSEEDKQKFDQAAEKSWKEYNLVLEKLSKKFEDDSKVKNVDTSLRTVEEYENDKLDLSKSITDKESTLASGASEVSNISKESEIDKESSGKKKIFFNENKEDLEDWLDSVLDD